MVPTNQHDEQGCDLSRGHPFYNGFCPAFSQRYYLVIYVQAYLIHVLNSALKSKSHQANCLVVDPYDATCSPAFDYEQ